MSSSKLSLINPAQRLVSTLRYINDSMQWGFLEVLFIGWWLRQLLQFFRELYFDLKFYKYEIYIPNHEAIGLASLLKGESKRNRVIIYIDRWLSKA